MERIILHADLNHFYAAVECRNNPDYKNVPLAVAGEPEKRHGIILAKNPIARSFGVKTGEPIWQARSKCPGLICVPPRFGEYMVFSRQAREVYYQFTPKVEPFGLDEAWLDVTGTKIARQGAFAAGEAVRKAVRERLDLTVSVGASFNKVFAKLGSDLQKPDKTTLISPKNFKSVAWPRPVEELLYVGPATKRRLNNIGVFTIGELAALPPAALRSMLGKRGLALSAFARGEEREEVAFLGQTPPVKSVGNSFTPFRDLVNDEDVKQMFYILAESVSGRLRDQGLICALVGINVRDCDLDTFSRQAALNLPTACSGELARAAMQLFSAHYAWQKPLRSVGLWAGKLCAEQGERQTSCFLEDARHAAEESLDRAVYRIRKRYGNGAVMRANVLGGDFCRMDPKEENVIFPAGFRDKKQIPL